MALDDVSICVAVTRAPRLQPQRWQASMLRSHERLAKIPMEDSGCCCADPRGASVKVYMHIIVRGARSCSVTVSCSGTSAWMSKTRC